MVNHYYNSFDYLYDNTAMLLDFRKPHRANILAVYEVYGCPQDIRENKIIAGLFRLYYKLTVFLRLSSYFPYVFYFDWHIVPNIWYEGTRNSGFICVHLNTMFAVFFTKSDEIKPARIIEVNL